MCSLRSLGQQGQKARDLQSKRLIKQACQHGFAISSTDVMHWRCMVKGRYPESNIYVRARSLSGHCIEPLKAKQAWCFIKPLDHGQFKTQATGAA